MLYAIAGFLFPTWGNKMVIGDYSSLILLIAGLLSYTVRDYLTTLTGKIIVFVGGVAVVYLGLAGIAPNLFHRTLALPTDTPVGLATGIINIIFGLVLIFGTIWKFKTK